MMEQIRTAANNIVVKIIFAIIILAFIFTGVGGFLGMGSTSADDQRLYIAKVDGEGISRAGFEQKVNQTLSQYQQAGLSDDMTILVRQRVFSSFLNDILDGQFADKLAIKISDKQVQNTIRQQNIFFVNGAFNNARYLSLLQQNGFTPNNYAELIRTDMKRQQLLNGLVLSDFVVPAQSDSLSKLIMQERQGNYASVSMNDVIDTSKITVTEDEISQYYQDNKSRFAETDRVKVKYIVNSYADALQKIKEPTEEQSKQFYQKHIDKYMESAKFEYTLFPVKDEAEAVQVDKVVKEQGHLPVDSTNNIIDLGWFDKSIVPDYLVPLNLDKKGESGIVNIDNQYYVAFLNNTQQATAIPFDLVDSQIKNEIRDSEALKIYNDNNDKLLLAKNKFQTIEDIAKDSSLDLFVPNDWQSKNVPTSIAANPELQNVLFSGDMVENQTATQKVSDIIEISEPKATYIVQVTDFKPEGIAPFDDVHDLISSELTSEKRHAAFQIALENIVSALNNGGNDNRLHFSNSYTITREKSDLAPSTTNMIFSLIPPLLGKDTYGFDINGNNSAIIAELKDVKNHDSDIDLSERILTINTNQLYMSLNADLRAKAKIEIMPEANL